MSDKDIKSNECIHPAFFNSMCVSCGNIIISNQNNNRSSSAILSNGKHIYLSNNEAQIIQETKTLSLKLSKKLALVLDLDHTLIHSCERKSIPSEEEMKSDMHLLSIEESPAIGIRHYLVKFRPFLNEFLNEMNKICQLSIYTAGTRKYAEGIAKLMDPNGKLFLGRIVSRSDNISNHNEDKPVTSEKSLSRIFLNDASLAVILDDREDVWRGDQSEQLLLVKPYKYFIDMVEVNNSSGPTNILGKNNQSIQPTIMLAGPTPGKPITTQTTDFDDQLLRSIDIIKNIHSQIYNTLDNNHSDNIIKNVGIAIKSFKRNVLKGCIVAFLGIPWSGKNILMNLTSSLGGRVTDSLSDHVTHVICVNSNLPIINDIKNKNSLWILHPDWLLYSRWALTKVLETTFSLIPLDFNNLPNPKLLIDTSIDRTTKRVRTNSIDRTIDICTDKDDRIILRIAKQKSNDITTNTDMKINISNHKISMSNESTDRHNNGNDSDSDDDWGDFDKAIKNKLQS